jgi:hypothetical protein
MLAAQGGIGNLQNSQSMMTEDAIKIVQSEATWNRLGLVI